MENKIYEASEKEKNMIKYLSSYKDDVLRRKNEVIPETYDPVFKSILTKCREYLAEVVHGITGIPKDEVLKGIIINSEFVVNNIEEKRRTSDLIIELKDNVINLEMNNKYYKYLNRRNNGYLYKIDTMTEKKKTIQINFNNFKSEDGQTIKKYTLKDENGKEEEGGIIKYQVYLENIKEKYYNNDELTKVEKYLLMIKLRKRKELKEISKGDKNMSDVYKKLDELSEDKYLSLLYDREEKREYEYKCMMEDAKEEAKEEGMSQGIEQGIKQGIKQGIERGIEQGISSEKEKIAKNLLSMNMSIEDISKATGLSIDEIKNL